MEHPLNIEVSVVYAVFLRDKGEVRWAVSHSGSWGLVNTAYYASRLNFMNSHRESVVVWLDHITALDEGWITPADLAGMVPNIPGPLEAALLLLGQGDK